MAAFSDFYNQFLLHVADDGAIWMGPSASAPYMVQPYFANLALIDILEANSLILFDRTGRPLSVAMNWLSWYIKHAEMAAPETDGQKFILRDQIGTPRNWRTDTDEAAPHYDSIDSYIATFLTLAASVFPLVADNLIYPGVNDTNLYPGVLPGQTYTGAQWKAKLTQFLPNAWALLSYTLQNSPHVSGLAKNRIGGQYYTEDNFEVYRAVMQSGHLPGPGLANPPAVAATLIAGLQRYLLNPGAPGSFPHFDVAVAPNGVVTKAANPLGNYYPDQQIQLLAISTWDDAVTQQLYQNIRPAGLRLPEIGNDLLKLDQVVWWGVAAARRGDTGANSVMEVVKARLANYVLPSSPLIPWIHDLGHAVFALAMDVAAGLPPHPMGPHFPPGHPHPPHG